MDFSALKKKRNEIQAKLKEKVENLNSNDYTDNRVWRVTTDNSGNGNAIIRFLMSPKGEDFPFVRYWSHAFKGTGGWYIENCLTTLGKDCPVCEANGVLWNSEIEANKNIARQRKRKLIYVSNILVVNDPGNKDNNGKVFLFKYGQKIFEKINDLLNPSIEGEEPINPFDFWDGCNFKLRAAKVAGYPNYDKSTFDACTPLFGGDDSKIEAVWNTEYSLSEFTDPKQFKNYEVLKERFNKVVGNVATSGKKSAADEAEPETEARPVSRTARSTKQSRVAEPAEQESEDAPDTLDDSGDSGDDILKRFQALADGD